MPQQQPVELECEYCLNVQLWIPPDGDRFIRCPFCITWPRLPR